MAQRMVSVALLQLANDLLALLAVQVRRQRWVHRVHGAVQRVPALGWALLAVGAASLARRMRVRTDIADIATGRTGVVLTGLV